MLTGTPSSLSTCSSYATQGPQVKFQLLVDVPKDVNLPRFMILPSIFRNQLIKNRVIVTLVDSNKDRTQVYWYEVGRGEAALGNLNWRDFYDNNLLGEFEVTKLCFKLREPNVFEVMCFNSDGVEVVRSGQVRSLKNRCLIKASDATIRKEFLPPIILQDMNQNNARKPLWTAKIYGPLQNADVDMIYRYHVRNDENERWKAVGFKGSKWSNLITVNGVENGFTMMFTDLRNRKYGLDVFNEKGIGVGLIDPSTEDPPNPDWGDVPPLDPDVIVNYESEESEGDGDYIHECRVPKHKHVSGQNPYFKIRLKESSLSHKNVTVPAYFVREQKLYEYTRAALVYGHILFYARLDVKTDARRPGNTSHVVMHRDWQRFLDATGFMVKDPVKFELKKGKSVVGGDAYFRVC